MKKLAVYAIIFLTVLISLNHLAYAVSDPVVAAETDSATKSASSSSGNDKASSTPSEASAVKPRAAARAMSSAALGDSSIGSNQNFSKTLTVDSRSGSPAVSIPLDIPSGRGGIAPSMGLSYSTVNGNGPFGFGWSMDLGYVVRSTKNGFPSYASDDVFLVSLGGSNYELVNIGNNEYRSKYDSDRMRFFFSNNVWTAKDKAGHTYYFGSRSGSTTDMSAGKTYRWRLDRIEDLFGNVLVVDYNTNESFEVRYGLMAGKNTTSDVNSKANFAFVINVDTQATDRSDITTDYKPGFALMQRRLVNSITITGGGNLLKKYTFAYEPSVKSGRSLLKKVMVYGADGVTSEPVINLKYSDTNGVNYNVTSTNSFTNDGLWNYRYSGSFDRGHDNFGPIPGFDIELGPTVTQTSGSWSNGNWYIFNGGQLTFNASQDTANAFWTYLYTSTAKTINVPFISGGVIGVYINGSTTNSGQTWNLQAGYNLVVITAYHQHEGFNFTLNCDLSTLVDSVSSTQPLRSPIVADFNGDGLADSATYAPDTGTLSVALSNKTAFSAPVAWISNFGIKQKLIFGDFNGDGRTDVAVYDTTALNLRVALSDGTKFIDKGIWFSGIPSGADIYIGDFNGGGFSDLYLMTKDAAGWKVQIAKSTGAGFVLNPVTFRPQIGSTTATVMTGDINGDGVTDLLSFDSTTGNWSVHLNTNGFNAAGAYTVMAFGAGKTPVLADLNQDGAADIGYFDAVNKQVVFRSFSGSSFGPSQSLLLNLKVSDALSQLQAADFNGDGINDFLTFNNDGYNDVVLSDGNFIDLVTSYDNGFGGKVDLTYASTGEGINKYMPFNIPVVKQVDLSNGLGDSFQTKYFYSGGWWDPATREMYGFKEAKVIDPQGNYSVTQFNQTDLYLRGYPDRSAVYGANGFLFQETLNQWDSTPVISGRTDVRFVSLKRSDNYTYDSTGYSAMGVRTAVEYTYDLSLGVPLTVMDYGEVDWTTGADTNTDLITTTMTYGGNTANNLLGVPVTKTTVDSTNAVISKSRIFYDGSTVLNTISKGLATRMDILQLASPETWISSSSTYNAYGQPITSKDANGNISRLNYDTKYSMFVTSSIDPKGFTQSSSYYGIDGVALTGGIWGFPKTQTDINGQSTTVSYDALGRAITLIGPLDSAVYPSATMSYSNFSNYRVIKTSKRIDYGKPGTLDSYTYIDGLNRTIMTKSPTAVAGQYVIGPQVFVDSRGLVTKEVPSRFSTLGYNSLELPSPNWLGVVSEYDALGRKIKMTAMDGSYTLFGYSHIAQAVVDANGHKTVKLNDARGRVMRMEFYRGATGLATGYPYVPWSMYGSAAYYYDGAGRLKTLYDGCGNLTTISYDLLGRKTSMNALDMGLWSYTYDNNGNLINQKDSNAKTMYFKYDALNRLISKKDFADGATAPANAANVSYAYDEATSLNSKGRLTSVTYNAADKATFAYDVLGRETDSSKTIDGLTYQVKRTYNALNQLVTLTYPDLTKVEYQYDAAGAVKAVNQLNANGTIKQVLVQSITYTAQGQMSKIVYGNGVTTQYTYDPLTFRLTNLLTTSNTKVLLQNFTYTYDNVGNILTIKDGVNTGTQTFTYDYQNRLISAKGGYGTKAYEYDMLGNILKKDGVDYSYSIWRMPHAVSGTSDGTNYIYDPNGNMINKITNKGRWTYVYDTENRLISVGYAPGLKAAKTIAEYSYDGDGARIKKLVYRYSDLDYSNQDTYAFLQTYLGSTVVVSGPSVTTTKSVYVGNLYQIDGNRKTDMVFVGSVRVAAITGSEVDFYHGDHLGSVNVITDLTGQKRSLTEYDPYGKISRFERYAGKIQVGWEGFNDKALDDETGLMYYNARYYDPSLGRFITADTVVPSATDLESLNRYSYCRNNPVNMVDPSGHKWSWGKFWNSFVGAVFGAIITIATGGLGAPAFLAGMLGGFSAGAITGGLNGGWQGALMGGLMGGLLGGLGGAGISQWGPKFGYGMLAAGGAYSVATGNGDSLAGGLAGGIVGTGVGSYLFDNIGVSSGNPYDSKKWEIRGVGTTKPDADNIASHNQDSVFFMNSRGKASDFVRAGMEKVFGPSRAERQLAGYMRNADGTAFVGHSEGTMLLAQAIKVNIANGVSLPNSSFDFNAPVMMRSTAQGLVNQIGSHFSMGWHLNPLDPIGVFTTLNPVNTSIYAIGGLVTLFHYHSGVTYPSLGGI